MKKVVHQSTRVSPKTNNIFFIIGSKFGPFVQYIPSVFFELIFITKDSFFLKDQVASLNPLLIVYLELIFGFYFLCQLTFTNLHMPALANCFLTCFRSGLSVGRSSQQLCMIVTRASGQSMPNVLGRNTGVVWDITRAKMSVKYQEKVYKQILLKHCISKKRSQSKLKPF